MSTTTPPHRIQDARGAQLHRMHRAWAIAVAVGFSLLAGACETTVQPPVSSAQSCHESLGLFATAEALAETDHPCREWIDATHGRLARSGRASAVIWTRRTAFATAVLVSALHTLESGRFGPVGKDVPASLLDPAKVAGDARLTLTAPGGSQPDDGASILFDLYHPDLPAAENTPGFFDILPRHDFFIAVVDGQAFEPDAPPESPLALTNLPVVLYDPRGMTTASQSFADAQPQERLMMIGYPSSAPFRGVQAASVGRVLSDAEAESAIEALEMLGDVEGDIPYDPAVEWLLEGEARGGMSGGGIFNEAGQLVGILVRASDPHDDTRIVRVVRMTFIVQALQDAFDNAPDALSEAVAPYVEALDCLDP